MGLEAAVAECLELLKERIKRRAADSWDLPGPERRDARFIESFSLNIEE